MKVTGDITVSFPASVLPLIYDTENAPMLSFLVRGTSCLEQILPNKALISRFVHFVSVPEKFVNFRNDSFSPVELFLSYDKEINVSLV